MNKRTEYHQSTTKKKSHSRSSLFHVHIKFLNATRRLYSVEVAEIILLWGNAKMNRTFLSVEVGLPAALTVLAHRVFFPFGLTKK